MIFINVLKVWKIIMYRGNYFSDFEVNFVFSVNICYKVNNGG